MGGWISRQAIGRGLPAVRARVFGALVSATGCLVTILAPFCPSPFWATGVIAASYFWATAGSVNLYTIPVDIWGGERAGIAISALVFAYGLLQTGISPVIGALVDHFGFTPVCWMVALPPLGGWLMLRRAVAS
jgi:ACS family hexuronate transporter-like MFS transporter